MTKAGGLFKHLLPAILWAAVIFLITGIPGERIPESEVLRIPGMDKLIHFLIFAVLGALLFRGLKNGKVFDKKSRLRDVSIALTSIIAGMAYGALTEYFQYCCLADRHGNIQDFIANIFGTVFGVLLMAFALGKKSSKK